MSTEDRGLSGGAGKEAGEEVSGAGVAGPIGRWNARYPRLSRVTWVAIGLAALVLLIWVIYPKPHMYHRFNIGPQAVGVARAAIAPIEVTLNSLGTVTPLATATVKPQVSGLLTRLYFKEGQLVKAGDPLAQIDPKPYQAALDQAKGQLARDEANLANARADLKRYVPLAKLHQIPVQQMVTQQALVRSDSGLVEADRAAVETASINLGYTRIDSPLTGVVGLRQVDIGNILEAGQGSGIVVVTELSPMSVIFTVPQGEISRISSRFSEGAVLEADAWDSNQTTLLAKGKLAAMDNVVDPATGTVKLRAIFDNKDRRLFPGQFVNIRLFVDTLENQTVVPVPAIQRGPDGSYVFVVNADDTVNSRNVTTGVQDGDKVAILKGLAPGETVVTDGADRLRNGAPVTIAGSPAEHTSQSSPAASAADNSAGNFSRAKARAEIERTCHGDLRKLCDGETGRGAMRCLFVRHASLSAGCRNTLESIQQFRHRAAP